MIIDGQLLINNFLLCYKWEIEGKRLKNLNGGSTFFVCQYKAKNKQKTPLKNKSLRAFI
jgi:hypothetical protein